MKPVALFCALSLYGFDANEDLLDAARRGDLAAVKALVEKGAAIESKTAYGQTPLYLAAMSGHEPVVQFLLEKGATTEVRDTFYKAPMLVFVLQRKHFGVAKMLVSKSPPDDTLSAVTPTGNTDLVAAVLERKPSQAALDKNYELALSQNRANIAELLKKAGAREPAPAFVVDPKVLESYAGTYKADGIPLDIKVSVKEGKLFLQATGQGEFAPKPKSEKLFEFAPAQLTVEFDGPDSFLLKQGGGSFKFKKAVTQ